MNRFENITKPLRWLMALLLVAVVAGCGGGDGIPVLGTTTPGAGPGAGSGGHGPTPVDLLSVGTNNFVILSKSGITDTGSHSSAITLSLIHISEPTRLGM